MSGDRAAATRGGGTAVLNVPGASGRRTRRRLIGVDAARGFALLGMVAVHTLPVWDTENERASLSWSLFAGHSAALFATLAGVSLAFLSGGRTPHTGRRLAGDRAGLVGRAAVIALVGFLVGFVAPPVNNILIYYGMFFLLAIPFLGLRIRHLLISSAAFLLVAPFLMQWSLDVLPAHVYGNPTLWNLVTEPVTVLSQLLLTGTYPALPYMAYLCAGIALGRMNLTSRRVQLWLAGAGAALALLAYAVSMAALLVFGVYDRIWSATPWMSEEQIDAILVFGPEPSLPTTTLWWLVVPGPHTNTPLALLISLGMAGFALGAFLLLARVVGKWLTPLAAAGSMTFTLYTLHLLFLATGIHDLHPGFWFWMQVAVFGLLAVAWQRAVGQGPLEKLVARTSKRISRQVAER
ncbi:heparan-alpha-glucosaminide N-acetyltransferase domain-containing protein [Kocuria sp. M1N1S27]|uniref:heparan-alpha-glucosaminide N-acetyltransferase domain-containing protein n=1 Tax=Kocuria kalidii TaxID=3376283 RepID=UPI0037B99647